MYWKKLVASIILIVIIINISIVINSSALSKEYSVTFNETGLPSGTEWSITVNNYTLSSNNSTITFMEQNGTYNFIITSIQGYRALPNVFRVNVNGYNQSLVIVFLPVLYKLTFTETGLPSGTSWNVTVGNQTVVSYSQSIVFNLPNGTYNYYIPPVNGIGSSIPSGTVTIDGKDITVVVRFVVMIQFTFFMNGLPAGTEWSIFINGHYYSTTNQMITLNLTNGTYNFAVIAPSGYSVSPSKGTVSWDNNFIFIQASSPIGYYYIAISIIIIAMIIVAVLYVMKTRKLKAQLKEKTP